MKYFVSLLLTYSLLAACGQSSDETRKDSTVSHDSSDLVYDTSYHYDDYAGISMYVTRNDTLIRSARFYATNDTIYYEDGCIKTIAEGPSREFMEKISTYDHEYVLRQKTTIYSYDGMGGSEAERLSYDTTGTLITKEVNRDYMPADAQGHLDICGVVTTSTYYPNGQPKSIEVKDHHYEGLMYCPCGTWEYFDSAGKLIRSEQYKKCGDGKTNCVEDNGEGQR